MYLAYSYWEFKYHYFVKAMYMTKANICVAMGSSGVEVIIQLPGSHLEAMAKSPKIVSSRPYLKWRERKVYLEYPGTRQTSTST